MPPEDVDRTANSEDPDQTAPRGKNKQTYFNLHNICTLSVFLICTLSHMRPVVRKPAFCICENKDVDQLRGSLCFRYMDGTIPLLPKSEISNL